jgi:hypothetical protein
MAQAAKLLASPPPPTPSLFLDTFVNFEHTRDDNAPTLSTGDDTQLLSSMRLRVVLRR